MAYDITFKVLKNNIGGVLKCGFSTIAHILTLSILLSKVINYATWDGLFTLGALLFMVISMSFVFGLVAFDWDKVLKK